MSAMRRNADGGGNEQPDDSFLLRRTHTPDPQLPLGLLTPHRQLPGTTDACSTDLVAESSAKAVIEDNTVLRLQYSGLRPLYWWLSDRATPSHQH